MLFALFVLLVTPTSRLTAMNLHFRPPRLLTTLGSVLMLREWLLLLLRTSMTVLPRVFATMVLRTVPVLGCP